MERLRQKKIQSNKRIRRSRSLGDLAVLYFIFFLASNFFFQKKKNVPFVPRNATFFYFFFSTTFFFSYRSMDGDDRLGTERQKEKKMIKRKRKKFK